MGRSRVGKVGFPIGDGADGSMSLVLNIAQVRWVGRGSISSAIFFAALLGLSCC